MLVGSKKYDCSCKGVIHMNDNRVMLKLADILFKEQMITLDEQMKLKTLIQKRGEV